MKWRPTQTRELQEMSTHNNFSKENKKNTLKESKNNTDLIDNGKRILIQIQTDELEEVSNEDNFSKNRKKDTNAD